MSEKQARREVRWKKRIGLVKHLVDILRAEAHRTDMAYCANPPGINICAEDKNGTLRQIGWVSEEMILAYPEHARHMIDQIKFAASQIRDT